MNAILFSMVLGFSLAAHAAYPESFALTALAKTRYNVSQVVKASAGAVLETEDEAGHRYRLTIAPNSLAIDTVVRMTPLEVQGVPGEMLHLGVDIEPAGTKLLVPAVLEIIPQQSLAGSVYWLETEGQVQSSNARPAFPVDGGRGAELTHFSGGSMVVGTAQTAIAMADGGKAGSYEWFQWQRNLAKQDLESGRIDNITFQKKLEIIEKHIGSEVESELKEFLDKSRAEAEAAIDRADRQAEEGDPAQWESFFDNLNTYLIDIRRSELLGLDSDMPKFINVLSKYLEALYRNCERRPMGIYMAYKAERIRQLLGIADIAWDLDKCVGGNKIYHVQAEYVFTDKKPPAHPDRYINNVQKTFDLLLTVQYAKPNPDIVVLVKDFNETRTKYDLKYEKDIWIGEGCEGTQSPVGDYEVFDYKLKTDITASYNPGFSFPPGVPVPPNFPEVKPSGSIFLMNEGEKRKLGWKVVAKDPAHCKSHDEPASSQLEKLNIQFDPVLLETIGTKKVESHVSEDSYRKEGWTYTIERVN